MSALKPEELASFHTNLAAKGVGARDWANTFTEVEHLGNGKFTASIFTDHKVFRDKADGKWKKHKLTDERSTKGYALLQSAKCCVEVYPYYAEYFDVDHEEVRLYEERWVVQRLFKAPDTWRDVGAYSPVMAVEETENSIVVTVSYTTDYGALVVKYIQRDGAALKHDIAFKNASDSTETFRVLQRWAGIVADAVDNEAVSGKKVMLRFVFDFEKNGKLAIRENLQGFYEGDDLARDLERLNWEVHGVCDGCGACCEAYKCQHYDLSLPGKCGIQIDKSVQQWRLDVETFQEWLARRDQRCVACFSPVVPRQVEGWSRCGFTFAERIPTEEDVIPNSVLRPVAVDVHAQGLKADFVYGNWTLAQNEDLGIDPATDTLNPSTATHKAYYSSAKASETLAAQAVDAEFSAADYTAVGASDDSRTSHSGGTSITEYGSEHYTFNLAAYGGGITGLKITLETRKSGVGVGAGCIWHYDDAGWTEDAHDVLTGVDQTLVYDDTTNVYELIDAGSLFHYSITIRAGGKPNYVNTDFVKLEVTYGLPAAEGGLKMVPSLKGHMGYDLKTRAGKARRRMF